ncbi:hypothetical protein LshimejAT787_1402060 [Lyophyllum shimeji]|uniref:F-box domain-containing protein n=1 Tax=Lyophyllum shimeji TaxID=47721 RepID=A0A9P3PYB2_LYOSH|nr:hypothetical protein LshimejAT787_1402060 [Lyophyllum shimeji]
MELSSIPREPLLHILEHLNDDELYILPHLCRRLNQLAIPILLRRQGVSITNTKAAIVRITLSEQRRTLSALRTAFFITSIIRLSCKFTPKDKENPGPETFRNDLREVVSLITRPIPVGFQVLHVELEGAYTFTSPSEERHLCDELFIRPKPCQSMRVSDENGDTRVYCHDPHAPPGALFQRMQALQLSTRLKLSCWGHRSRSSNRHPSFTLNTYQLYHHRQLLPDNLPRTLTALRTVVFLSLQWSGIWGAAWSDILPRIAAAATELRTVAVDPTGIYLYDLVKFISSLPKIEHLLVRSPNDLRGYHEKQLTVSTPPKLPLLTYLSADLAYLPVLLAGNLPKLRDLYILAPIRRGTIFSPNSEKILTEVVSRLEQRDNLWSLEIHLSAFLPDVHAISRNLDDFFRSAVGLGTRSPYAAITDLKIFGVTPLRTRQDYEAFAQVLSQWLRRFPGAQKLSLSGESCIEPSVYPIFLFLHAIHTQAPNIWSVVIQDTFYNVVKTMTEHERTVVPTTRSPTRKLGDLDEDIFYVIFHYLETQELYPLSTLSRNLRAWVLPVYLWRRGYQKPTTAIAVSLTNHTMESLTDLSALILSPIQSISSLSFRISPMARLFVVFEFLRRLLRLVRKLSTIEVVTLDLGVRPYNLMPEPARESAKVVWTELLVSIMNAISEKAKAFNATGQGVFGSLTLPCLGNILDQGPDLPKDRVPPPMKRTLTGFDIECDILRLPALRDWFAVALKDNTKVTRLSLSRLTHVEIPFIEEAACSLPMLRALKMEGYDVLPEDILYILSRFPLLSSLSLEECNYFDPRTMRPGPVIGRKPQLSHLRDLAAPVEYIVFLLERADALPALENIKVTTIAYLGAMFVTNALKTLQTLNDCLDRLHSRGRFPTLAITTGIKPYMQVRGFTDGGWEVIARSTTTLHMEIENGWGIDVLLTTGTFRRFLRPWIGLQHLVMKSSSFPEESGSLEKIVTHLRSAKLCPNLRTVATQTWNGTGYELQLTEVPVRNDSMVSGG